MKRVTSHEWVNSITHLIGFFLSISALVIMILYANKYRDAQSITGAAIFGSSLVILYLASTLYHFFSHTKWKPLLRQVDHMGIYLLIAGTYTFYCLSEIRGTWGWALFASNWAMAIAGIIFKFIIFHKEDSKLLERISVFLYLFMGWSVVIGFGVLKDALTPASLNFLMLGGAAYTGGVIFYLWEKLPYNHGIWHLFVIAGSLFHFFGAIYSF